MKCPVQSCSASVGLKSGFKGWRAVPLILVGIVAILAIPTNSALAQTPVTAGYRDFNYGTATLPFPSGQKTESKLWWNDGSWWGALWSPVSPTNATAAWHIYQFDESGQDWVDTGTAAETQNRLVDCLWDDASQRLYIVSHTFAENGASSATMGKWGRLYRFSYGSATKTYTLDSGFPTTTTLANSVTQGVEATLTIAKDSRGILWVSYVEGSQVMVNHSTTNDATWGTPFVLPGDPTAVNATSIDISGVVSFGGNKIGVMWSNIGSTTQLGKFYFAVHNDGDADTAWQSVETAMPAPGSACTGNCAHRHLNVKVDSTGNIYAAGMTGTTGSNLNNSIFLMVRNTSGTWSNSQVSTGADAWVRPVVLLDEQNSKVYTFANSPGSGGVVYYKSSPLGTISFPTGIGTQFIQSLTDPYIANAASTKQGVNGTTGLLILASDSDNSGVTPPIPGTLYYLHNFLPLPGGSAPVITSFSPTSGLVGASVTITGSSFTGASAVTFSGILAGIPAVTYSVDSDSQITATVPTGATTGPISVTTTGGTGPSSTIFTVIGPPVISSFNPTSGAPGAGVTIVGSGFTGTTGVAFNGTAATFTVSSDTQISATVPTGATTGKISVTTARVPAATSSSDFTVLIQAPVIASFVPIIGPVGTNVTLSGSGFLGATIVTFNGTTATQFSVTNDAQMTAYVPSGATTGPISITAPNGTGTSSTSFTVTASTVVTSFSPTGGPVATSVTITGSLFTGATAVRFNGISASFTFVSDTQITATVPASATTGPISVTTQSAGTGTSAGSFTVIPPPVVSSFTPTAGPVGASVAINGSAFTGATAVTFNGVPASFTFVSDIQVTATVPAAAATGPVSVTTAAGTGTSSTSFTVTGAPVITSFSPASGTFGTSVRIRGSGFTGATTVAFNGTAATFTGSASSITATVPSGATSGPISVTTPSGTVASATNFTVLVPPQITSFSPTSGPVGTTVAITGANFTGAKSVKFNGKAATFTLDSDTQITATVPSKATSGPISVTNALSTATSTDNFTVTVPPVVSSFTPTSTPVGTSVTIKGSGFTGATDVAFNGSPATTFTVVSATSITAMVPSGATTGHISVTTPVETAASAANFTVSVPPQITGFSPSIGPVGTIVTITGVGFTGATSVSFNGKAAKLTVNSDTQITATVPKGATTGPISVTTAVGTATSSDFTVQ